MFHRRAMPKRLGGKGVPNPDRAVAGCRHQACAVRGEGEGMDIGRVAAELGYFLASGNVPKPNRVVLTAGGQRVPFG